MKEMPERVLQDDEDFLVEVIDWEGRPAIKKSAKSTTRPERLERLQNEVYGLCFFADLTNNHPELDLYIPQLFDSTSDYIVTEYIDRPPVGDDPNNLKRLAHLLADIDRIKPYGEAKITPNFDYQDIRNRFPVWTKKALASGIVTQAQIDKANEIIDSLEQYIQPRIAHGDLSTYAHAFMMPNDKIALIDFEVFTPAGARYYDVARCYTRLYSSAKSTGLPKQFLKNFIEMSDKIDHRDEQLLAIIIQRTIGMQRDAAVDNAKGNNYKQRAAELLDLVLQSDLKLLHT